LIFYGVILAKTIIVLLRATRQELLMKFLKILLFCTYLILLACNPSSNSGVKSPNLNKVDANRTCVPESELLAGNIVGGQVVQTSDIDSKKVMMLVSGGQLCTAVAIDKKILLTAAHCIAGKKSNTYVTFYSSHSCESGYNKNKHNAGILKTVVHENYNSALAADKMIADIALVVLEEEIPAGYAIYKIAKSDAINSLNDLYLYGYGRVLSSGGGAGMLRKSVLNSLRYKINFADRKIEIDQKAGGGICQGDSGGPSFVLVGDEMQVLGISSYVKGDKNDICFDEGYQTLADSYKDWIDYKRLVYK